MAARPVGASSTIFCLSDSMALTMAPASVVLPVPAEPRRIMAACGDRAVRNEQNVSVACSYSDVGMCLKACLILLLITSTIMFAKLMLYFEFHKKREEKVLPSGENRALIYNLIRCKMLLLS